MSLELALVNKLMKQNKKNSPKVKVSVSFIDCNNSRDKVAKCEHYICIMQTFPFNVNVRARSRYKVVYSNLTQVKITARNTKTVHLIGKTHGN